MPRFLVGNFEFEHTLADEKFRPGSSLARLEAELAASWLAVAEDGDFLWCPQPMSAEFFAHLRSHGGPVINAVSELAQVPAGTELMPWGWTNAWRRWAAQHRWSHTAPEQTVVRVVNSRDFSFRLEQEWKVDLPGSSAIIDVAEIASALNLASEFSPRAVIKANWGMSGRERLLVEGPLNDTQHTWLRKRLAEQKVAFVEPWVELVDEVGIQIEIPPHAALQLIGLTPLVCDRSGQYRGNWCTDLPDAGADLQRRWQPALDVAFAAAVRMQQQGYFGPLGIDAVRYRLPDGSVRFRPLQDINARWTMGRLSLGWRRLLRSGEHAFWQHGVDVTSNPGEQFGFQPVRVIDTSPEIIGNQSVRHRSRLWIYPAER